MSDMTRLPNPENEREVTFGCCQPKHFCLSSTCLSVSILPTPQISSVDSNMTEHTWGWLVEFEKFGRLGDTKNDYTVISYDESRSKYPDYMHASHGMLYSKDERILWKLYNTRAAVLMQMRFDGVLGFPGGLVEKGEEPVFGMNREMEEEIGLDLSKHRFTDANHVITFLHADKKLVLHFYMLEAAIEEFRELEMRNLRAPEYGTETFGVVRVPLFTMGDGLRGLPAFLANHFAGNAKEELIIALEKSGLLTKEELQQAVKSSQAFNKSTMASSS